MAIWLIACTPRPDALTDAEIAAAVARTTGIDREALLAEVSSLVAAHALEEPTFPDGPAGKPHRRVEGTAWVADRFSALGLAPRVEEAVVEGLSVTNVVAELAGASPELVLVTSHHDVWYTPADDNSSAVVAMLAIAEALRDEALQRTVRFVSFDQEETNFGGSLHHYGTLQPGQVHAVVNMDSIAYADAAPGSQSAPIGFYTPETADFLAVIGNGPSRDLLHWATQLGAALPDPLRVIAVYGVDANTWPLLGDLHRSDHSPAWLDGIPAAFLTDTTEFRNDRYHTERDTVESLDPAFFEKSTKLALALTWVAQERP